MGDRLGDLETGHCWCRDVVVDSPPVSPESCPVSLSLSAIQGGGDEGAGPVTNEAAVENELAIPILVCGQQACRAIRFRFNPQSAPSWEGGVSTYRDSTALRLSKCWGGGRSLQQRQGGRELWVLLAQKPRMRLPMCQGHSTLSSQHVFEGAWLTQLVQLVTAGSVRATLP